MISETRQITFSPDELIEAVSAHFQAMKQKLPPGQIVSVAFEEGPEVLVALTIDPGQSGKAQKVIVRSAVIGAAMISHCKRRKIPVPRHGVKSLIIAGDSIGLVISTNSKPTALFEIAQD